MSQEEILEILELYGEPVCLREIVSKTNISKINVSKQIKILLKHKEIKFYELTREEKKDYCKKKGFLPPKTRMRLYFLG